LETEEETIGNLQNVHGVFRLKLNIGQFVKDAFMKLSPQPMTVLMTDVTAPDSPVDLFVILDDGSLIPARVRQLSGDSSRPIDAGKCVCVVLRLQDMREETLTSTVIVVRELEFAQRVWRATFFAGPSYISHRVSRVPFYIAICVGVLTLVLNGSE
jgi:hypothetical protein